MNAFAHLSGRAAQRDRAIPTPGVRRISRTAGAILLPLLLSAVYGCARSTGASAGIAPWLRVDPRRCLILRDLRDAVDDMARRCAEAFVIANGYTVYPPTGDSSRWVAEDHESGDLRRVVAGRVGMLMREAVWVQCGRRECSTYFQLRDPTRPCTFRSVRMSYVFTRMRMDPVLTELRHCRQKPV